MPSRILEGPSGAKLHPMPTVSDVLAALEEIAPTRYAFGFDKVGLQVGDPKQQVQRAVVSFDRSLAAAKYASATGAQLLVAHHPLLWDPLKRVVTGDHIGDTVRELVKGDVSFIAAHTNWDAAPGGINDTLARLLRFKDIKPFGEAGTTPRLKLIMFVPEDEAQKLIDAASEAGAGVIGMYTRCAYMSPGVGTFYSPPGTNPTVGEVGEIEQASEMRIEMVLPERLCGAVTRAIVANHPYEEPAYDFVRLTDGEEMPIGRVGTLEPGKNLRDFQDYVDVKLDTRSWTWGNQNALISKVAVVGGAADDHWRAARAAGADVLITGEVKQHVALEACEAGFAVMAAGHYATENPGARALLDRLAERMPDIDWSFFDPEPGYSGRPL